LLNHWYSGCILFFLHFELLLLCPFGANIRIVPVDVAEKAHDALVLFNVLLILHQELVKLLSVDLVFLTVGRLVAHLAAVVATDTLACARNDRLENGQTKGMLAAVNPIFISSKASEST
jgi:hypothetical protein